MHPCSVARALALVLSLFAQADASTNATASPARSGNFSSTANQPGVIFSEPPNARDEERVHGMEDFGLGTQFATLLTKSKQAVWRQYVNSLRGFKVGWWRLNAVHPSIVYTNLELGQVKENILSNVRFRIWVKYVDGYNLHHPGEKVSIFAKLWSQFDDYELAMMLEQAKSETKPSIQALGTRLQSEQMAFWRDSLVSPGKLYDLLQSDPRHPSLLTGSAYNIWKIYFSDYDPGESMPPFARLLHSFDDLSLSSLLISSKRSKETATLAINLQLELEKVWLRRDVAPELVFKFLMLDKNPYAVFDNLELKSWMRYAHMYREKTGKDVSLDEIIKSHIETDIMKVIISTAEAEDEKYLAEALKKKLAEKLAAA